MQKYVGTVACMGMDLGLEGRETQGFGKIAGAVFFLRSRVLEQL